MGDSNTPNTFPKSKINIGHPNIRLLTNRDELMQLKDLVYKNKYNTFVVPDSWLNSTTVTNTGVSLEGHKLSRLDRTRKIGKGVCVYTLRNSLLANILKDLTETSTTGFKQV